jgi:hypothetical protein
LKKIITIVVTLILTLFLTGCILQTRECPSITGQWAAYYSLPIFESNTVFLITFQCDGTITSDTFKHTESYTWDLNSDNTITVTKTVRDGENIDVETYTGSYTLTTSTFYISFSPRIYWDLYTPCGGC